MTLFARRWIRLAALAASLAVPLPAFAAEVVRMGDLPAITNAGLYIAIEKGYFQARGITVETERFASAGKMIAPLATGQLDVAVGAPSAGLYNAIAGGMDFRVVADKGQLRPGGSFVPVIVRKDLVDSGRVKSIKDLKGLKVANGAKGITLDYLLAKLLEQAGLGFDAVDVVYLSYPDAIKALASKAVDAAIAPEPWGVQAEQQKAGVRLFLTEQTPAVATFQVGVIMYAGKFIKERPKVAREFLQAYVQGIKYYSQRGLKDPEVAGILSKHTKVPVETIQATIPFYVDPGARPRVQDLATLQDWFHQMGWVKEKVPMERVVDLSFLE
ncbi:MAG: ABC transporter substrate-binding protein [Candidatus Rokubacteria bacterium]|nr:ABC transporter substrate-binding protein [Candidatus Rokubacteria bacterium]